MTDFDPLTSGPLYRFDDWPVGAVPRHAAGVYTIWEDDGRFLYVGMAGRGLSAQQLAERQREGNASSGLWSRLNSHASGRRSGDQFCVYVCDRLVLSTVDQEQIAGIAAGTDSLDTITRDYIRDRLSFRFTTTVDGAAAFELEREVQRGALAAGKPFLNPL